MADTPAPDGLKRLAEIAGGLTFVVALIGSWLYLAGWTYAFRYFGHYRLGLAPLAIPKEYFFQYGVWVARAQLIYLLLIVVLLLLVLLAPATLTRHPLALWGQRLASACLLAALYLAGQSLAEATADADAERDRNANYLGAPGARVWLGEAWDKEPALAADRQALANGCFRLLFQNEKTLFLFRPQSGTDPAVLVITRDAVKALRLLPSPRDCP